MPGTDRASACGICYHVINRGNAQIEVFHKDGDYRAFVELIGLASQRIPMRVLAYCVSIVSIEEGPTVQLVGFLAWRPNFV